MSSRKEISPHGTATCAGRAAAEDEEDEDEDEDEAADEDEDASATPRVPSAPPPPPPAPPPALSDCDSQLVLVAHFSAPVRLSGVALLAAAAGAGGAPPTRLHVYLDRATFSFEDVEGGARAAAELAPISARDARAGRLLALPRAHSLPACRSVTLFVDAEGADAVALLRVQLVGRVADDAAMDFTKLQAG